LGRDAIENLGLVQLFGLFLLRGREVGRAEIGLLCLLGLLLGREVVEPRSVFAMNKIEKPLFFRSLTTVQLAINFRPARCMSIQHRRCQQRIRKRNKVLFAQIYVRSPFN
ncbi:MAG: hypothetical protein WBZ35_12345, partial [Pseudolabrys sp.]